MNVNVPPHAVRTTDTSRVDLLLIAEMVTPGSRVLDIGCGDGTLLRLLAVKRGVDGRGIELSQAGVNSCVAQGLVGDPRRRRHRPRALSRSRLRLRHPVVRPSRRLIRHATCSSSSCASASAGDRVLPQFRPLARAHPASVRRQDAEDRQSAGPLVRHAEHPSLHHQGFRRILCRDVGAKVERAVALNAYGTKLGVCHAAVRAELVRRAGRVPPVAIAWALGHPRRYRHDATAELAALFHRHRSIDLLRRLDQDHAGEGRPQHEAKPLPEHRPFEQDTPVEGRHVQRVFPVFRREHRVLQELGELRAAERAAMSRRAWYRPAPTSPRRFGTTMSSRPFGASTRHSSRSSGRVRSLPFEHVHEQEPVGTSSSSGSSVSSTRTLRRLPCSRPGMTPSSAGMSAPSGAGIGTEGAEIGRGETEAEQALAVQIAPARSEPRPEQAAHHAAERGSVEILEIDGIELHRASSAEPRRIERRRRKILCRRPERSAPFQSSLKRCYGPRRQCSGRKNHGET